MAENVKLKQQLAVRDALDESQLSRADLTEPQLRLVDRCETKEHVLDLVESLGLGKEKPRVGPKHKLTESADDDLPMDDLLKRMGAA